MVNFFRFLISKQLFKHILIATLVGITLIILTFRWLLSYTHHGEYVNCPDLKGLSEAQFKTALEIKGLRYTIVDSIFTSGAARGTVLEQTPAADQKVKKGRQLQLIIQPLKTQKSRIPHIQDQSLRQASSSLESQGFQLGEITYIESDYKDLVKSAQYLGQEVQEGQFLPRGSFIDLKVGKGPGTTRVDVPNLLRLPYTEAEALANAYSLTIGTTIYDTITGEHQAPELMVYKQSPESGKDKRIYSGMSITIWLTNDSTRLPIIETSEVDSINFELPAYDEE